MKRNSTKTFEENLRNRLSTEELPFDENAWQLMEQKLNDEDDDNSIYYRSSAFKFLLTGIAIALLLISSTCIYQLSKYSTTLENVISEQHTDKESLIQENGIKSIETKNEKADNTFNNYNEDKLKSDIENNSAVDKSNSKNINNSEKSYLQKKNDFPPANKQKPNTAVKKNDAKIQSTEKLNFMAESLIQKNDILIPESDIENEVVSYSNNQEKVNKVNSTELLSNNLISELSPLDKASFVNTTEDKVGLDFHLVEVKHFNPAAKHNLNFSFSMGQGSLDISAPTVGELTPVAIAEKQYNTTISYLHKIRSRFGIEVGANFQVENYRAGIWLPKGTYGLTSNTFSSMGASHYIAKLDPFINVHYYQYLNPRLELDFSAGFIMSNPFQGSGSSSVGQSNYSLEDNLKTLTLRSDLSSNGWNKSGTLQLGLGMNFISKNRNSFNIGFLYHKELYSQLEGNYFVLQNSDEVASAGTFTHSADGLKFNIGYTLALKHGKNIARRFPKDRVKTKQWFLRMDPIYGVKSNVTAKLKSNSIDGLFVSKGANSRTSVRNFSIGNYVNDKLAIGFGFESNTITTLLELPTDTTNLILRHDGGSVNIPVFAHYDFVNKGRWNIFGEIGGSFDLKYSSNYNFSEHLHYYSADKDRLIPNAHINAGVEFNLFGGLALGVYGKYNHAFDDLYSINVIDDRNLASNATAAVRNNYYSYGIGLRVDILN